MNHIWSLLKKMNNKILFLGDICTDSYSSVELNEFKKTKLYKFLDSYDGYIIGNLEAPLLDDKIYENKNKFSLINKCEISDFHGFCHAYNLANNHIMDQGDEGFNQTIINIGALKASYFGAGEDLYNSRKPLLIDFNKEKIAILSYCCFSTNSESYADLSSCGPSPMVFEYIKEDIEQLKNEVDFIYIMLHWGVENEFFPTFDQVSFARKIIDLGADGIIGGHTHTIQSFETYNGKDIYYSIGNLFFNNFDIDVDNKYFQGKYNKEGLIVEISFENGDPVLNRYPVVMGDNMIPELSSFENLKTDVINNNQRLKFALVDFKHEKLIDNLNLKLEFNGESMQVINESVFVLSSYKPRLEAFKSKLKRVLFYQIKKRMKNNK